ncbi:alpha/beta fold hydrolase [Arthrobacter sp. H14]|uniref:alpha/beta fold hydrolase n=1 Tax=Arthrobacter sp. H14 TaxID=1312959 RepID=UPI0023B7B069|nr:alpha/beta hydrolase [Arthrobacter sp. H14]
MVHGGMCSSARWSPLWPVLGSRFRVTAMDRRGRGLSGDGTSYTLAAECADVAALAENLSMQQGAPIDVFGHSYGALCALGAAAQSPSVRRLVLYEPPGTTTVSAEWIGRMRDMIDQGQPGRAMFSFLVDVVGMRPGEVELLRDRDVGYDPMPIVERTLVREAEALAAVDVSALAADVVQPVLLLRGSEGPPWAADVTMSLAGTLSAATVATLQYQGHEAVDSAPELIAEYLDRFLSRQR